MSLYTETLIFRLSIGFWIVISTATMLHCILKKKKDVEKTDKHIGKGFMAKIKKIYKHEILKYLFMYVYY